MTNKTALTEFDYERLSSLARAVGRGAKSAAATNLEDRLRNSLVFKEEVLTEVFVRMNSVATLSEIATGENFIYRLVFPADADISAGRISVLSPLGAALLGRREGETFGYESPGGTVQMRVEKVLHES